MNVNEFQVAVLSTIMPAVIDPLAGA